MATKVSHTSILDYTAKQLHMRDDIIDRYSKKIVRVEARSKKYRDSNRQGKILNLQLINYIRRSKRKSLCQTIKDTFHRLFYPKWFAVEEGKRIIKLARKEDRILENKGKGVKNKLRNRRKQSTNTSFKSVRTSDVNTFNGEEGNG